MKLRRSFILSVTLAVFPLVHCAAAGGYLGSWKLDDNLSWTIVTHNTSGALTDADAAPAYRIYEDETAPAILTGTMALLDDTNTTGHYSEQIALSAANGFEKGKSYNIYVSAAVGGTTGGATYSFQMEAEVDANVVSATNISSNVAQWNGAAVATPTVAGVPEVDVTHHLGTAAPAPTTGGIPLVEVDAFGAGASSDISALVSTELTLLKLDKLLAASVAGTDVTDNSVFARVVSSAATADWDTYAQTTDSLQAIRDRGDAAWTTATAVTISAGGITAASFGAGAIDAAAVAADAIGSSELATTARDEIVDQVWDEALGDHETIASTGERLGRIPNVAAGASGGLFIAGANAGTTVNFTGNLSGSVGSVTAAVTVGTNNDKTGYSLTDAGERGILEELFSYDATGSYATAAAGSVVKEIADNAGGGSLTTDDIAEAMFTYDATATYATANAGSVVKQIADNAGGSSLTEAGIATAVWANAQRRITGFLGGDMNESTAGRIAYNFAQVHDNDDEATTLTIEDFPGDAATSAEMISEWLTALVPASPTPGTLGERMARVPTQQRVNRRPDAAFIFQVSRRADGTYKCTRTLHLAPGAVEEVHPAIDMSPLFGQNNFVADVGTPTISGGSLVVTKEGPRDWFGFVEVGGTATASESRTISVPITMESGAIVQVKLDVSVFPD